MAYLSNTTAGKCEIKPKEDCLDAVCDLLEEAGFESGVSRGGDTVFGDNFDEVFDEKKILALFDNLEDLIDSATFTFTDFIIGEGEDNRYFKYEDYKWFSGTEETTVSYSEMAIPGTMSKEFRTVTNIQWSPDIDLLMELLENVSEEKAAKGMELPLERYHNMTYEERLNYLYDMLHHNRVSDYMLTEIFDMPYTVVLPRRFFSVGRAGSTDRRKRAGVIRR